MIYISSFCIRASTIKEVVEILHRNNFKYIELSGGTDFYDTIENDLIDLKAKHKLEYICHNYFPPPKQPLVLNLASLNDDIYQKTLLHLEEAIRLSKKLNAEKFGFHAGFFIDVGLNEIGRPCSYNKPFDKNKAIKRFCEGFNILKSSAGDLELYIENNVLSYPNLLTFKGLNPFMMTNYQKYLELKKLIDFKLLLDIGHLKVSSNSLGLNFQEELDNMIAVSDYLHFSDNDGLSDQHSPLWMEGGLFKKLRDCNLRDKTVVSEIRENTQNLRELYKSIKGLLNG